MQVCDSEALGYLKANMVQHGYNLLLGHTPERHSLILVRIHPQEVRIHQSPGFQRPEKLVNISKLVDALNRARPFDVLFLEFILPCLREFPVHPWAIKGHHRGWKRRRKLAGQLGRAKRGQLLSL